MTTYSPTALNPRLDDDASETTVAQRVRNSFRAHLGTYVAGVGATAALTAGALVVFLSVATFVGFRGFPFGGSSDNAGSAYLEWGLSGVPTAAGLALGAAPAAVADDPVAGSRGGSATAAGEGSGAPGPGAGSFAKAPPVSGPGAPGPSSPPGDVPSPTISVPSLPSTSGPITNAVRDVDATAGTNLSGPSGGVTRAVDGAASGALNQGGRAAGRPGLGTRAGSAVGALPGPG